MSPVLASPEREPLKVKAFGFAPLIPDMIERTFEALIAEYPDAQFKQVLPFNEGGLMLLLV